MADVKDYTSGKILRDVKLALFYVKFVKIPIIGSLIKKKLLKKILTFEPKRIDMKTASDIIQESKKYATGERVCRAIYTESEITEAVFLDELAEGMVEIGKARYVTKEEAVNTLEKYPKNPLILSKVAGKYMEMCRSSPKKCVYWTMERYGLKCFNVKS